MKKIVWMLSCILLISPCLPALQTDLRPMTTDDALNLVRVGDVLISPSGNQVFFSRSTLNWEKNKRDVKYFMIPAVGGNAFQYIGESGGSGFRFSPDGNYLAFKRKIDKKNQIFLMPNSGGEGIVLTKHETEIGAFIWAPDSRKIIFAAPEPRSKEEEKEHKAGNDAFFVDEGPNGQTEARWRNLWTVDIEDGEIRRLTDENLIIGEFSMDPRGDRLAFSARRSNRRNDGRLSEIYLFDITDKKIVRLTDNRAPESSLTWAPDGETIAFTAADAHDFLNRNPKIFLLDPRTKTSRLLSTDFEGGIRGLFWTPDSRSILFNGQQGTDTNLFRVDAVSGETRKLTSIEGTLRVHGFSRDRKTMVYTFTDFDSPPDIYASPVDAFNPVRLTDANPWVAEEIALASMTLIKWKSKKNFEIEGLLHLPADHAPGRRHPLILNIHGGPAGCFTNSFRASHHVYAGLGYASLSPNVRGSSGYTDKLREGNSIQGGDGIGYGDYDDLMNGVNHVIKSGVADPERMALKGWSYGGILGGWTLTRTDRFRAASIGAGVYDWASEYGPGFNYDVRFWHIGGTPWDNPRAYRAQSAFTHVADVVTPTLLIHGMNDTTDTEAQSMLFFTAVKDIGKAPVRYLRVPREPHGFREPRHQRMRDIEEIRWMQKHVLGSDWVPWERETEKKPDEEKS